MAVAIVVSMITVAGVHADAGQVLSGKVVSEDGPVEGAAVYMYVPDFTNPLNMDCIRIATSDKAGAFRFNYDHPKTDNLQYIVRWLIAYQDGYAVGWKMLLPDEGIDDIEITLGRPAAISGTITDMDGRSVRGAHVAVITISGRNPGLYMNGAIPELTATTDDKGMFMFDGLPENMRASLLVTASGYVTTWISGSSNGSDDLTLELEPAGRISGTVTYTGSGDPAPNAKIIARMMGDNEDSYGTATANDHGEYEVTGLRPGMHQVTATMAAPHETREWADVTIKNIEVKEGKTTYGTDIELVRGGLVTGTVTDEETGAPIPGVLVSASPADKYIITSYGISLTDESGVYTLRAMPGDVVVKLVSRPVKYPPFVSEIITGVADGETTEDIDFQLRKGRTIRGRTIGPDDDPIAGVTVRVKLAEIYWRESITAADGMFTISGLSEGLTFNVEAEHAGKKLRADATLSSDADGEQVIRLEKYETATITGRIVDEAQNPVQGVKLHLAIYDRNGSSVVSFLPYKTGSDGVFVIKDLLIGRRHLLYVYKEQYAQTEIILPPLTPDMPPLDDTVLKKTGQ